MTEIVFGAGAVERVTELAGPRAFVVTDPGIVDAGHVTRLESILAAAGVEFARFDHVTENPTERDVDECVRAYGRFDAGGTCILVAIGGGSAIDVAKGCARLASGGGRMRDYLGRGPTRFAAPLVIAIPTTAGTGSEVQSYALIGHSETGQKMACGGMSPVMAILDPELTVTMPRTVTACTGLDTLAHAVESLVSRPATDESRALSREAFLLVTENLPRVLERPDDLEARGAMLLASARAGAAIEQSMLGAAHSMANPLTKHCGIVHGRAVGVTLPAVVRFNAEDAAAAARYAELARSAGLASPSDPVDAAVAALAGRLDELVRVTGFPPRFPEVPAAAIATLAAEASAQWTARFNPREVDAEDFGGLYRAVVS